MAKNTVAVGSTTRRPDGTREHIHIPFPTPGIWRVAALGNAPTARKPILLCYESMPSHQEGNSPLSVPCRGLLQGRLAKRRWGCDLIAADVPIHIVRKTSFPSSGRNENSTQNAQETLFRDARHRRSLPIQRKLPVDTFILAQIRPSSRSPGSLSIASCRLLSSAA